MDEKTKQDFIQLFNQGFEEVVLPHIEELREDVDSLKKDVNALRGDVDAIKAELHDFHLEFGANRDKTNFEIEKIKRHIGLPT